MTFTPTALAPTLKIGPGLGVLVGETDHNGRSTLTARSVVAVGRKTWNKDFPRKSYQNFDDAGDINVVLREEDLQFKKLRSEAPGVVIQNP